ncbi:MAG TPA: FeoB small GTPase domain-containing protein, partial [Chitinophagaceae bacterium]|nr:FeoB small GTPase domain-containing protein [Chitinophagaceae bacterium]
MATNLHIALLGNPNSGKSSLFNALTGMNQKVGNFPGVTVEKKSGTCQLSPETSATIIDLPGSYSLYPRRADEWVAYRAIMEPENHLDLIVVIVDASNLQRNLLYASQVADLEKPVVIALSMMDLVSRKGVRIDVDALSKKLNIPIVVINPRKNEGIKELKRVMERAAKQAIGHTQFIELGDLALEPVKEIKAIFPGITDYTAVHTLINHESMDFDD